MTPGIEGWRVYRGKDGKYAEGRMESRQRKGWKVYRGKDGKYIEGRMDVGRRMGSIKSL